MAQAADMTVLQINFKTVNVYSGQAKRRYNKIKKGDSMKKNSW